MTPSHRPPVRLSAAAARRLVRLVLWLHPREFRRRFGDDVLRAVEADLAPAPSPGRTTAGRAATRVVIDAIAGLTAARSTTLRDAGPARWQERRPMGAWWRDALSDLRLGLRGFRREPAWTTAVIATLALGIGVNAAMFGVADRLLLSGPEHIYDAGRVRRVQITRQPPGKDVRRDGTFPYAAYDALRRGGPTFEAVAGYAVYADSTVVGKGAEARRVNRGEATAGFFPLLGVAPIAGRFFTPAEDDTIAPQNVVVIGYELWQQEFGGRPDAVGQPIVLDNTTYTLVGVTPRGFTGPDLVRVDVWYPESLFGSKRIRPNWTQSWNAWWLGIVVRLAPGVTDDQADRNATALFRGAAPPTDATLTKASLAVRPLTDAQDGTRSMEARVSTWLAAVAGIVLLVSCANVVNLMLVRGIRRRREIAVRAALGARSGRLIRLLMVETVVLSMTGGAVGLAVAYSIGTLMRRSLIPGIEWPSGPVNVRVLVVSIVVSIAAGLLVGLLPAWRATSLDVSSSLKTGVREGGGGRQHTRAALTMVQAALSALLLVGSGLFVVSLHRVRMMDLGLQPDRVLTLGVRRAGIPAAVVGDDRTREIQRRNTFYPMALEALQRRPEVEAAALTIGLPFWNAFGEDIHVPGLDKLPDLKGGGPFLSAVTADYFKTVGTRILRGRGFTTADRAGSAPVAIISETMARTVWPGQDPVGHCFTIEKAPACVEIVGIAANVRRFKLQEEEALAFYIPFGQEQGIGGTSLIVRPRGEAARATPAIRQALVALDPSITFVDAGVLADMVEPQLRPWELGAAMFSLMGALALVVAAVGLYSVMSYFVTNRSHELGVRIALGARPGDLAGLVVRGGVVLAISGVGVGLGLALLAGRLIEPLLFKTSPADPAVYAEVAATLVAMALVATALPAARARRINPVEAMRTE
jgi:predicted permease